MTNKQVKYLVNSLCFIAAWCMGVWCFVTGHFLYGCVCMFSAIVFEQTKTKLEKEETK